MYSNFYIFRYASIMVILVAAILSTAAMLLKPYQDRNIAIDKMQGILESAKLEASTENAIQLYNQYIINEIVINSKGELVSEYKDEAFTKGDIRAFDIKVKEELFKKSKGVDFNLPILICDIDGEKINIIPMYGKGLWGPIWGNIALSEDYNEIIGVYFDHKAETPGLGAEISKADFMDQYVGKNLFDENKKFMSIDVIKGGIITIPEDLRKHGVDAISGGTITSKAVEDMMQDCLENYVPYFKKQ